MKIVKIIALGLLVIVLFIVVVGFVRYISIKPQTIDTSNVEVPKEVSSEELEQNKILAQEYYQKLYSADYADAISSYLDDNYIEHQTSTGYSKSGLQSYVQKRLADYPAHKATVYRVIAQGDHVFLHVEEKLTSDKAVARGELFRFAASKIVEHWSAEQEVPENPANDNGMLAGPQVNTNSTVGPENADHAVVAAFEAWVNFNVDNVRATTTERYIQHNPLGRDGVGAFVTIITIYKFLRVAGIAVVDLGAIKTIAEGDFVVIHSRYHNTSEGYSNVFDILRLTEDGKKDEHWDVIELIESEEDLDKIF